MLETSWRVKDKTTDSHQYRNAHVLSSRIAFHLKIKPVSHDMTERLSSGDRMVKGEVQRALPDQVVVKKQVCIVGHSFVRRLRMFMDAFQARGIDRQFGLELLWVAAHGIGVLPIELLRCSGRDFVQDKCPDIVILQTMDNDMDTAEPIDAVVQHHVELTIMLAALMGGTKVVICAPLHRSNPKPVSAHAFNENIEQCSRLLRRQLLEQEFANSKMFDRRAFSIPNVYLWVHRKMRGVTQLLKDGVHLTDVGNTRLYFSLRAGGWGGECKNVHSSYTFACTVPHPELYLEEGRLVLIIPYHFTMLSLDTHVVERVAGFL